jgi:hypothetical protein
MVSTPESAYNRDEVIDAVILQAFLPEALEKLLSIPEEVFVAKGEDNFRMSKNELVSFLPIKSLPESSPGPTTVEEQ